MIQIDIIEDFVMDMDYSQIDLSCVELCDK